jgi:hypothetical protein
LVALLLVALLLVALLLTALACLLDLHAAAAAAD